MNSFLSPLANAKEGVSGYDPKVGAPAPAVSTENSDSQLSAWESCLKNERDPKSQCCQFTECSNLWITFFLNKGMLIRRIELGPQTFIYTRKNLLTMFWERSSYNTTTPGSTS